MSRMENGAQCVQKPRDPKSDGSVTTAARVLSPPPGVVAKVRGGETRIR